MRRQTYIPFALTLACLAPATLCHAQQNLAPAAPPNAGTQAPDAPRPQAYFKTLFPNPTGENGYEEFVAAGDLLNSSVAMQAYNKVWNAEGSPGDPPLTMKRRLLDDSVVRQALNTFRMGLRKPIHSPHETIDATTTFPQYASFRSLSRLLAIEQYVALADGRVGAAIDSMSDSLKLGYRIQTDSLISGLVGVAIDAISVRTLFDHLDQLTPADCDNLLNLVNSWMRQPDPSISVLAREREATLTILHQSRPNPMQILEPLEPDKDDDPNPEYDAVVDAIKNNPQSVGPMFDTAETYVKAQFDHLLNNLNHPYWERKAWKPEKANSLGERFANLILPSMETVTDRYAREQTTMQMLGVHAAIHRYLWEYNRLPATLGELKLGQLVIDPFTGKPFAYQTTSARTYELTGDSVLSNGRPRPAPATN